MMPFDLSLRRLLLKYVPQLTEADIARYESLIALRHQLIHEKKIPGEDISEKAHDIFDKYETQFNAAYNLVIASRQFALEQRNFSQIPPTVKGLRQYFKKLRKYRTTQVSSMWKLGTHRGRYMFKTNRTLKSVSIAITTGLVGLGLVFGNLKVRTGPEVSDIPDQIITVGSSFRDIHLDEFVADPKYSDKEIKWTATGSESLKVTIRSHPRDPVDKIQMANIRLPLSRWIGSETIVFTAQNPKGFSDSDSATFTVIDTTRIKP